jgi:peptidoglycan/LPS O-acetylase OafA/YrhL
MDRHLAPLTGLRGVAAYSVLAAHLIDETLKVTGAPKLGGLSSCMAYFGMSLFFVLSGFVLFYTYGKSIGRERWAVRRFFVARFARLYPLYAVVVLVSLVAIPDPRFTPLVAAAYATMTQTWFNVQMATFAPAWSISAEWLFYFTFVPLVFVVRGVQRPALALAAYCLAVLATLSAAFSLFPEEMFAVVDRWLFFGPASANGAGWFIYFSPPLRLLEFVAGMMAARLYLSLRDRPSAPRVLRWAIALSLAWCAAIIVAGAAVPVGPPSLFYYVRCNFLFAPALAALMVSVCLAHGRLAGVLSSRPLQTMGDISYSVYLWQFSIMAMLEGTLRVAEWSPAAGLAITLKAVAIVGLTTTFAYGSHALIEVPARRWIRAVLEPRKAQAAVEPVRG